MLGSSQVLELNLCGWAVNNTCLNRELCHTLSSPPQCIPSLPRQYPFLSKLAQFDGTVRIALPVGPVAGQRLGNL